MTFSKPSSKIPYYTGIRRWTPEEDERLKWAYSGKRKQIMPRLRQITEEIGRTIEAAQKRAKLLKITHGQPGSFRTYTLKEIGYIEELYKNGEPPLGAIQALAKNINRSTQSVRDKAFKLGLSNHCRNGQFVKPRAERKKRKCLYGLSDRCLGTFESNGPGNRACDPCKETAAYKSGGDMSATV